MFGVTDEVMPPTYADFVAYVRRMVDEVLAVGDDARAVAAGIFGATVAGPTWLSRPAMELAAAALLPGVGCGGTTPSPGDGGGGRPTASSGGVVRPGAAPPAGDGPATGSTTGWPGAGSAPLIPGDMIPAT